MAAPAAAPDEVRPIHSAALRFCPAPSSSPFYWITPEQRAGASTCIGPAHQRIGGIAAPLAPAAVVHADLLPVHQPGIEKRQRRAPAGAAVKSRALPARDAGGLPLAANLGGRLHAAVGALEGAHAVDVTVVAGPAPARAGNIALGGDITIPRNLANKFIPGADADQNSVRLLQQCPYCSGIHHVFGMGREAGAEIGDGACGLRRSLRARIAAGLP